MFLRKASKSMTLKALSLALVGATVLLTLASCGGIKSKYNKYDRTGQKYDYDLTEYVSIPEYMGIEIPDISYTATQEDVEDNKYKKLAYFADEYVVEDGEVEKYDLVVADYFCTIDGVEFRDLCSTVNESYRNFMAGIRYFMIPEVDDAIIGMKAGETKVIDFTFPKPYYKAPSVSGLDGHFEITVQKIRRQEFPEYDDEFVSEYYGAESADAYTDEIKEQLEHDVNLCVENYEVDFAWDYIISNSVVKKFPKKEYTMMSDSETNYYIKEASKKNMSLEEYATKELGLADLNALYDQIAQYAESAVRDEMILYIIARCENIELTDAEYSDALMNYGQQYEASDIETCELIVTQDYGSVAEFRRMTLLNKVYEYIAENTKKIDCDTYFANKEAGLYKVNPDDTSSDFAKFKHNFKLFGKNEFNLFKKGDSALFTVRAFDLFVASLVILILVAAIVVLVIVAVKTNKRQKAAVKQKDEIDRIKRERRERREEYKKLKQEKKNENDHHEG